MSSKFNVGDRVLKISQEDSDLLGFTWHLRSSANSPAYFKRDVSKRLTAGKRKSVYMHREVMERVVGRPLMRGEIVDHIDRDSLNNRRDNLRITTKSGNALNTSGHRDRKKNKFLGAYWHNKTGKYHAKLMVDGKHISCGYFDNPEDAHLAYMKKKSEFIEVKRKA